MRFLYKNTIGQVFEYDSEADRMMYGSSDLVQMTEQEVADHLAPPPLTEQQIVKDMRAAIQAHMDDAARGYGYDDVKAAVTYADEPAVPKFQAEGRAFRAWRSLVWAHAYGALDDVQTGKRQQPTVDELIAELPALEVVYGN